jgi:hypothetical protein
MKDLEFISLWLSAACGHFNHLPPKHEPERFVFPWQPIPDFPIFSAPQAPEGSK